MTYLDHFVNAAKYSGYVMLSASDTGPTPMGRALSAARGKLTVLSQDADWLAIYEHVGALAHAGISVVGFEKTGMSTHEWGFHVLVLRRTTRIDLADEQAFVASFGRWLDKLKDLLPRFHYLPDEARSTASAMATAPASRPGAGRRAERVLTFAQGTGPVKSLAVLPAHAVAPAFLRRSKTTDLVSEPSARPWIIKWLWDPSAGTVTEAGRSPVEQSGPPCSEARRGRRTPCEPPPANPSFRRGMREGSEPAIGSLPFLSRAAQSAGPAPGSRDAVALAGRVGVAQPDLVTRPGRGQRAGQPGAVLIAVLSTAVTVSPACRPALAAAEPSTTPAMVAPWLFGDS